ncbi:MULTISPECIES: RsmB/NOP family class I SAM-dependent RNA methyltransferase [unclassified Halorubrum]|uniref:RsmB/NOP family class I SAM-dependent RNA methyltransferase n=1 Tax=unclassified Halorubrum TaxID=2642239 RepID=UPI000B9977E7|nr:MULTISPECIES: RsmB/NOP family class I SAM-dependent RNA methyltransferase [unclassified Halorubrum]OYR43297.1 SAM-dependent methyltransferase [Halorubrum sp. Hd13]OYR50746.1 SAM-dependent methyltransferase [Halorubrum sp. Ea1]
MNPLERYEPLVDDASAFRAACDRPLPSVVRVNEMAASPDRVREAFDEAGVAYEPVAWHDGLLRLPDGNPGGNWPYVHGWTHGQEEVSVLPGLALDPRPGERVWDACAAPGSKTTQIADAMDDEGTLVANDNNLGRLSALRHNAERLGITNAIVTNQDARNFSTKPLAFDEFDRALVDAPCSCEGTCRKNPDVVDQWTLDHVHAVAGIQKGVLARAVQATRPGGTVVYSTCTFAPEENEAVLDHVISNEDCEVVEFDLPLDAVPGVTEWEGETFDESVTRAHRVYPHHNDTGGFFCAKLRVGGDDEAGAGDGEVAA